MSNDKKIKLCDKMEELSREMKDNLFEIIFLEKSTRTDAKEIIKDLEKKNSDLLKHIKEKLKNLT